ncbi:MAG TPA: molybdopterin molybdenumtransferase MoeA [Deltaproteobacteria bacterium]|nr:MAG: molybdopterin molybdenumtransferase MoeA [Deltaproteobacteria bacterium GWA2_65_63]OGP27223.1 MAG: molybdopterin molybdenumtransferase MoeA [Deltaproteobacteria bacterium GWB2_65_81]OGP40284.1 MAG: molybdopterin molybdenumtransferase MoeA [Deltaproteobacteria bacterium GWC2_66_88]OGP77753.1 MAG: molybdopterin molybdenumtransferase MoeA [Deltaproteobacteria bacterium RBG_16_66_15]HAM33630.1 molybdopterin molybdenumtransferase MoeA [Deltaproteobacteria bacterium]
MLTYDEARERILDRVSPLGAERIPLDAAAGRSLAGEVRAPADLPPWDNSAMDGYAVRSSDCPGEAVLAIAGYQTAGGPGASAVHKGAAVRIMTGSPIPEGCDAVVPFEEAEERDGSVRIPAPVRPRQHIRFRGEDIRAGAQVIPEGTILRPPQISLLASFGRAMVPVYRKPRVAVLSTGDELVELGEPHGHGKIVNSNSHALAAAIAEAGGDPLLLGIARDEREDLRAKLSAGLAADVLVTSAGVSAGDRDLVRDVLSELGVENVFWKVLIKPGGPTAFGLAGTTPVFSLPGNPVSSLITFEVFVRPAVRKMTGSRHPVKPPVKAALGEPVTKKPGKTQFLRVMIESGKEGYLARTAGDQNTGILRTLVLADGIAVLPSERTTFPAGEMVDVLLLYRGG